MSDAPGAQDFAIVIAAEHAEHFGEPVAFEARCSERSKSKIFCDVTGSRPAAGSSGTPRAAARRSR